MGLVGKFRKLTRTRVGALLSGDALRRHMEKHSSSFKKWKAIYRSWWPNGGSAVPAASSSVVSAKRLSDMM